jgi:hypothetical protein
MRSLLQLLLYLQTWMVGLLWLSVIGLVLLLTATLAFPLVDTSKIFFLSLCAYAALAVPYVFAWYPFRQLLANRQLGLLPHFPLKMGLVVLFLTLVIAIYPSLSSSLFAPGVLGWNAAIRIFFACSLGFWGLQWICARPRLSAVCGFAPLIPLLILQPQVRDAAWTFLQVPGFDLGLLLLSLFGWLLALRTLATARTFAPPSADSAMGGNVVAEAMGTNFNWLSLIVSTRRQPHSADGTLLLGYPDAWHNRVRFYGCAMLVVALVIALLPTNDADATTPFIIRLQKTLPFALFGLSIEAGNLAARSRLLWLRHGGDRNTLWRSVERILLGNFVMVGILMLLLALLPRLVSAPSVPLDDGLLKIASAAFPTTTYAALAARAKGWGFSAILGVTIVAIIASAIAAALSDNLSDGFFTDTSIPLPLHAIALLLVLLPLLGVILLARGLAKRSFLRIDWRLVQPLRPALRSEHA